MGCNVAVWCFTVSFLREAWLRWFGECVIVGRITEISRFASSVFAAWIRADAKGTKRKEIKSNESRSKRSKRIT